MNRSAASLVAAALFLAACTSAESATGNDSGPELAVSSTAAVQAMTADSTAPSSTSLVPTTAPAATQPPTTAAPTTVVTRPVATTLQPPPGPLFGIAVPQGRIETIEDIESELSGTFHLVRVFTRWEVGIDDTDIAEIQEDGRAIHLSVRPVRSDGSVIPWAEIASTPEGSALHDEMVQWADDIVALGPDARFTFNHEPETKESAPNGNSVDYRGAWRRMVELIRSRGGNDIQMVWTVGSSALSEPEGSAFYPGDDVVDVVGADLYNWFTCQGTNRPWVSFEDLLEPAVAFAAERGKPLALPEFATAADPADPSRRAGWMDAAVDVMTEWDPANWKGVELDFVAWFDVTAPGGTNPDCQWEHRTDVETERAFGRMVRDLIRG